MTVLGWEIKRGSEAGAWLGYLPEDGKIKEIRAGWDSFGYGADSHDSLSISSMAIHA